MCWYFAFAFFSSTQCHSLLTPATNSSLDIARTGAGAGADAGPEEPDGPRRPRLTRTVPSENSYALKSPINTIGFEIESFKIISGLLEPKPNTNRVLSPTPTDHETNPNRAQKPDTPKPNNTPSPLAKSTQIWYKCAMSNDTQKNLKGRGAGANPVNRYDKLHVELEHLEDIGLTEEDRRLLRTEFFTDSSRTIVNKNNSPDIPWTYSINPYRGCEHGCAYCYARPTHEYLGLSAGYDFESKIFVKQNAAELLREKFHEASWEPDTISVSGVTDCYQPAERKFKLTRQILEVMNEFKNPVGLITKNALITRDIDILTELAKDNLVAVFLSLTTLDDELARDLEPRTSSPRARLQAVEQLAKAGVPVGVNLAPMIPGLNDHEMPALLKAAQEAGAKHSGFTPIRLPSSVLPVFTNWLERVRPERAQKVLNAVKDIRGGKLNDPNFGSRFTGEGPRAENMRAMYDLYSRKYGFNETKIRLSRDKFKRPLKRGDQMTFF